MRIAYGSSRPDTRAVCGDENNGFGLVIAWGTLGAGEHRMQAWADGRSIGEVTFSVVSSGETFLTDLQATYELSDFPAPGQSVEVQWSEAEQNFVITDYPD